MESFGKVRINDYQLGSDTNWKEGYFIIQRTEKQWQCVIKFKANKNPSSFKHYKLSGNAIKRYTCRNKRVLLELQNGVSLHFKNEDVDQSKEFHTLFDGIKNNSTKVPSHSQLSLSKVPGSTRTSPLSHNQTPQSLHHTPQSLNKTPHLLGKSPQETKGAVSPRKQLTTSPSPNARSDSKRGLKRELDDEDNDGKENVHSSWLTTDGKKPANNFLQRGTEKSRETLASLKAVSFYQNSEARNYGTPNSLSLTRRKPGLLPDPEKYKRPRLIGSASYSWNQSRISSQTPSSEKKQTTLQGFSNLGNTCYMNAILQSLFGLDTMASDLLNRKTIRAISRDSLYSSLACLLNAKRKPGLTPEQKRQYLRNVKSAISSSAKRFSGNDQHDAHEFLCQVLDQLKEEVIKVNKCTPSPERENDTSDLLTSGSSSQEYTNPTTMNFEFEVLHSIKCSDCGEEVTKSERFHDLSVDLPRSAFHTYSVQDALDQFFCKEEIEYSCERCGGKKSVVSHKYTRLPRILILHLKRYTFSASMLVNVKMGRHVHIPKFLTLQSHCVDQTQPPFPPTLYSYSSPVKTTDKSIRDQKPGKDTSRKLFTEYGSTPRITTPTSVGKFSFRRPVHAEGKGGNTSIRKSLLSGQKETGHDNDLKRAISESEQEVKKQKKLWDAEKQQLAEALEHSKQSHQQNSDKIKQTLDEEERLVTDALEQSIHEANQIEADIEAYEMDIEAQSEVWSKNKKCGNQEEIDLSDFNLGHMSEEEQLKLALERSICEAQNQNNDASPGEAQRPNKEVSPGNKQHQSSPSHKRTLCESAVEQGSNFEPQKEKWIEWDDSESTQDYDLTFEGLNSGSDQEEAKKLNGDSGIGAGKGDKSSLQHGKETNSIDSGICDIGNKNLNSGSGKLSREEQNGEHKKSTNVFTSSSDDIDRCTQSSNVQSDTDDTSGCEVLTIEEDEICSGESRVTSGRLVTQDNSESDSEGFTKCKPRIRRNSEPHHLKLNADYENERILGEDNKENETPEHQPFSKPDSDRVKKNQSFCKQDPDWLEKQKEKERRQEEEELQQALKLSLTDCGIASQEDEDLKKAKELSLQDCNDTDGTGEDSVLMDFSFNVKRSKDEEVQLKENAEKGCLPYSYRLVSVVSHMGSSSVSGHYICDVNDIRRKTWSSFDDSEVSMLTEKDVRIKRERTGYIFFYMEKSMYEEIQEHYATQHALEMHSSLNNR